MAFFLKPTKKRTKKKKRKKWAPENISERRRADRMKTKSVELPVIPPKRMMEILIKRTCRKRWVNCKNEKEYTSNYNDNNKKQTHTHRHTQEQNVWKSRPYLTPHKNEIKNHKKWYVAKALSQCTHTHTKKKQTSSIRSFHSSLLLFIIIIILVLFFGSSVFHSFSSSLSLHVFMPIAALCVCVFAISLALNSVFDNILYISSS